MRHPRRFQRTWDGFLLLTPHHLLETKELHSSRPADSKEPPEFTLPKEHQEFDRIKEERCPQVVPEPYLVSFKIEGQRYRFDYRLAFDLALRRRGIETDSQAEWQSAHPVQHHQLQDDDAC